MRGIGLAFSEQKFLTGALLSGKAEKYFASAVRAFLYLQMSFAEITDSRRINLCNITAPDRPFAVHESGYRVSFSHKNLMKKVFRTLWVSSLLQRIYPIFNYRWSMERYTKKMQGLK